ncbi:MAG: hypothetical protein Q8O89_05890 [Nanoarchaeota archaeon]|nr:hypothetical protein [Nanoarchaeota archaeon]
MDEEIIKEMEMNKKGGAYISTSQFLKGDVPKEKFWKYFVQFDAKDHWNWICLAVAVFLFWWSFKTMISAFS